VVIYEEMSHVFRAIKMSLNKEHIKENLKSILQKNELDKRKINLFVHDFIYGIENDWITPEEADGIAPSKGAPKVKITTSEVEFCRSIDQMKDNGIKLKNLQQSLLIATLGTANQLKDRLYGIKEIDAYSNISDKYFDSINDLIEDLSGLMVEIPKKKTGRKKKIDGFIMVRYVFVLSDCLLDVKGAHKNNNHTNLFNRILRACYDEIGSSHDECAHYVNPCFEDYDTIYKMAFTYKKYDRLDLYVNHVRRTDKYKAIFESFEDEWSEWNKPANL
jgi:hypothetical protein